MHLIQLRGRRQTSAVSHGGGNGPGVHQSHRRHLPLTRLGTVPVGIVAGHMADGKLIVGRNVGHAEAGAADGRAQRGPADRQTPRDALIHQVRHHRHAGRVHAQADSVSAYGAAVQNIGHGGDVLKHASTAAADQGLVHHQLPVPDLIGQVEGFSRPPLDSLAFRLHLGHNLIQIFL